MIQKMDTLESPGAQKIPLAQFETAKLFLRALFDEKDHILIRPIEMWTEDNKKRANVAYNRVRYISSSDSSATLSIVQLTEAAAKERLNLFFGVCPRFGIEGRFDLAWQIRTVRCLWCDIDHISAEAALAKVISARLPEPSIVVNSGNGVHLYWLLDEPYLIDDVPDPPAVLTEWVKCTNGKRKSRKYLLEDGQKSFLDKPNDHPDLSPKAVQIQQVLAGIAKTVGGDHTFDLSRLLRVPGTLNRKDQRNGREPVPCELVSCYPDRKYSLSLFESFALPQKELSTSYELVNTPLPLGRPVPAESQELFKQLVADCAVSRVGERSEADWRLICKAVETGWSKTDVWAAVATVGKFAERGLEYFERTWTNAEEKTRERIQQRRAKSKSNPENESSDKPKNRGWIATLAEMICEEQHFAQDEGGKLYRFQHGVYVPRADQFVQSQVKRLLLSLKDPKSWNSRLANEVVEFIRVDSPRLWARPPNDLINVRNGLLDLSTMTLQDHSPDHLSTIQLPVIFDSAAQCTKIDKFVSEVFPADAQALAYEIPAWLMSPDSSIQKAVLLIGTGGDGKSRYLKLVEAFLGRAAVSNLSLHRLESDKFACARLYGKLANICPDLPTEHLSGTSIFKAITGGDTIVGEYKFRDSFEFTPFARLVFSANSPPRAHDASDGFFDRWLVIPFDRRFRGEGVEIPSEKLDEMLREPQELSGLLNKALACLDPLRSRGKFSQAKSVTEAFHEFHAETDPLAVWLATSTLEGPTLVVSKSRMIAAFNDTCGLAGRPPMTHKAFGQSLRRLRPNVTDAQKTIDGKLQWCYLGIGLNSDSTNGENGSCTSRD